MKFFSGAFYKKLPIFTNRLHVPGFTLIELLVVISIIGLLASISFVSASQSLERGRDVKRKADMDAMKKAMAIYFSDHSRYPDPGPGLVSNSLQPNWLPGLVPNYIKALPKDPQQASIFSFLARIFKPVSPQVAGVSVPSKSKSYNMPVLVLNYFPTRDGVNLDSSITGITATLTSIRSTVNTIKNETLQAVQDGSKYHGYSNPLATPALNYSIYAERESLTTLPAGVPYNGVSNPDYMQILTNNNICDLVNNHGVREVWLFGWHYGNIAPVESKMSGPYGDISNSARKNDMPICSKTYVLYNYNYGRSANEATHDHGHQIEAVLAYFGNPIFWDSYIGPWTTYGGNDGSGANYHRCGWTHAPPNTGVDYDYANTRYSWTDCEDWTPDGSGAKTYINCSRWQCDERKFHIWRWQNMPGKDNSVVGASNWWDFIGDFDSAWETGEKLTYDVTPPTVPTGLAASNILSTQLTLSWSASTDASGVYGYTVKRNGVEVGSTSTTTFTDYTVSSSTTYQYTVSATDTLQNTSADSAPLSVTTNSVVVPAATRPILDSYTSNLGYSYNTYSWQHNVGNGTNRFLIVGVGIRSGGSVQVSGVTYNGIGLANLGSKDNGGLRTEFWALKNPIIGNHTITVTLNGATLGSVANASSWFDVDQANPTGVLASALGTSTNPSVIVPSTNSDVVVDSLVLAYSVFSPTPIAGPGQNAYWNSFSTGNTRLMGSSKDAVDSNTSMSWNNNSAAFSMIGVALKFGSPTPIITPPGPSPAPPPEVNCPPKDGVYCYVVSAKGDSFTLWGKLENINDKQIWNVPGAICSKTPGNYEHYNYCVENQ